jgi:microcystin-dependent protein
MTIQIKHAFVSLKGDGTDATQVQPSYWNAAHSFTMQTANLIGRLTAGVGNAEEIPITAYMAGLLNTADAATLAGVLGLFETGDIKYTFRNAASPGWVLMLGGTGTPSNTIGNAASGAALRANADTFALYQIIYNGCTDGVAPVSGGRTGNVTNDFNSGKTIQVPNPVGRAPIGAGSATASTVVRALGERSGAETHTLLTAEIPAHSHGVTDPGHIHNFTNGGPIVTGGALAIANGAGSTLQGTTIQSAVTNISINNAGGGGAHNNMMPFVALNVMVKL